MGETETDLISESEQEPALSGQGTSRNSPPESSAYADISVTQDPEQENGHNSVPETRQTTVTSQRLLKQSFHVEVDYHTWRNLCNVEVCCICLAKYVDNEELRELPCTHFFHKECVDKWLKINALCPLCKTEVGDTTSSGIHITGNWGLV
ncbi:hypothetical protein BHE74_00051118 [Ensete ventricosum]|nr:hypothetical protein BHE74_00051118 [Ensete ventricosum]